MLIRPDMRLTQQTPWCQMDHTCHQSLQLQITDNTKSIGATPLAGDSWPAGINSQVETTVSGASLPHLPLISEPNEFATSPFEPEKSTELLEMVELSESMAGKRNTGNGKADSRKWFRNETRYTE